MYRCREGDLAFHSMRGRFILKHCLADIYYQGLSDYVPFPMPIIPNRVIHNHYSIENIMISASKRPTTAVPHSQLSQGILSSHKKYRQQVCHSQNLNNSEVSRATKKLPLLLIKLKLQELGFRAHQYNQHVNQIEEVEMSNINTIALDVINTILNQQRTHLRQTIPSQPSDTFPQPNRGSLLSQPNQSNPSIMCSVCYQNYERAEFTHLTCGHRYCKQCLGGHIKNSIDEARYQIPCLEFLCEAKIEDQKIQTLISESLYKRYRYFKRKKEVEKNPNNKFCSVPNCEGILEEQENLYLCPECKADYCLSCIRPRHDGDCSTKIQEIIERSYQDYNIKKCPSCRAPIQKMDGCNHMSCKNCTYQFCWLCLGKYSKYHYRYFNCCGCPGMQFENEEDRCCERIKQSCVFLILPPILLLIVLTICTLLPFYLVAMMFIKPIQKAMQFQCLSNCGSCCSAPDCCDDDDSDCDCCADGCGQNSMNLGHFFVGLLMLPYGILYAVTIAPLKFFMHVYEFVGELLD